MKKIMKKALSLILVLALAIVPMTVMAAGESVDDPEIVSGMTGSVTVPAGEGKYFAYQVFGTGDSSYNFEVSGSTGFKVQTFYNGMQTGPATADTNGTFTSTIERSGSYAGGYYFAIVNTTSSDQTYNYAMLAPLGTSGNPAPLELGVTDCATPGDWNGYMYKWTAPQAGKFTVVMKEAEGWTYTTFINGNYAHAQHWYDDDPVVSTETVVVAANDVIELNVNSYDAATYGNPVDTVTFFTYFEADVKEESNAWADYDTIAVGDNAVVLDGTVTTTLYEFSPTETGIYTVTVNSGMLVSKWGANTWPAKDGASSSSVEITCTSVGQGFLVGVEGESAWAPTATVTVTRTGNYVPPVQVTPTNYENKADVDAFEFKGDETKLEYVDVEDTTVDKAVLGADGYYHLNTEDGAILYASLSDGAMDLTSAWGYGQLKEYVYEGTELTAIIDYYNAFEEYVNAADDVKLDGDDTTLYPLTEDLMVILQDVGTYKNWYGENGFLGLTADDAWMFLCCYEVVTTGSSTPAPAPVPGSTTNTDAPKTGDNANVAVWAIVMVVAAGAAFVVAESKRRAR